MNAHIYRSLLILLISLSSTAMLIACNTAHSQVMPLYDHLATVNAQWSWAHTLAAPASMTQNVRFDSDAARIQTHLRLVGQLLQQPRQALTESQNIRRQQCLQILREYAEAGCFPQNTNHTERMPYFIDRYGTACAVGYLMIATGYGDLAQYISQQNNYAYLCELLSYPSVVKWANHYGFMPEELALIQPTYASVGEYLLYPDGDGTNGTIYALHTTADWGLLIGGSFSTAGGIACNNIARRTNNGFSAIGNGLNGTVRSITTYGGQVYAGGLFSNGASLTANIARWNGSQWLYSNIADGSAVLSLHVHNGNLYAAGGFGVQKRTTSWIAVGGNFNATAQTLNSHNGFLIAGGDFTQIGNSTIQHVAIWNTAANQWLAIGTGLDAPVYALHTLNGELYAGGRFFNAAQAAFGLAHWNNTTNTWQSLIYTPYYASGTNTGAIYSLQSYGNRLLIGGDFWLNEGKHLAFYDPATTDPTNLPALYQFYGANDKVYATAIWGEQLYMGGILTDIWGYDGDFIDARNLLHSNVAAVQVPMRVQLQGAYDTATGQMRTTLRQYNLLPTQQPFGCSPWFYNGTEAVDSLSQIPNNAVDWVLVEARNTTDINTVIDSRAAWLLADGRVLDVTGDNALHFYRLQRNTPYRFSVRHRNHLAVVRAADDIAPSISEVGFWLPEQVLGGAGQLYALPNGTYALLAGDFNADGVITVSDHNRLSAELAIINEYLAADGDLNRAVTTSDFNLLMANSAKIGVAAIRY